MVDIEEEVDKLMRSYSVNELRSRASDRGIHAGPTISKDVLARRLASYKAEVFSESRRGSDVRSVDELMVGDTLTNRYSQKWKVREEGDGSVLVERLSRGGRPKGETKRVSSLDGWDVRTPGDTKAAWSGYSKEGGHRIM